MKLFQKRKMLQEQMKLLSEQSKFATEELYRYSIAMVEIYKELSKRKVTIFVFVASMLLYLPIYFIVFFQ